MQNLDNKYIIMPKRGFKSKDMLALEAKPKKSKSPTYSVHVPGGSVSFVIVDSISKDGLKVATMSSFEARELRHGSNQFRILPIIKYKPARRPIVSTSRKALASFKGTPVQTQIFVMEEGTDKPLSDVVIIAIVDIFTGAGLRRRTGITGQATITLPEKAKIEELYFYPPPGYWGKYIKSHPIIRDEIIYLRKIDPKHPDFLKQLYKTPRKNLGKGVKVAVIDTGVDPTHPDINLSISKNCVDGESKTDLGPSNGHGTHVAGIIASTTYGIAPGVELCSYKVFPHVGSGTNVDIARAIDSAIKDNCDLINLSLETGRPDVVHKPEHVAH